MKAFSWTITEATGRRAVSDDNRLLQQMAACSGLRNGLRVREHVRNTTTTLHRGETNGDYAEA
ncbi:hypothetical protein KIN20_028576 [Parelaphostrongylus tenuis]|uniref:Uncharacterized protein n=1 Tax=Parelaphostrongylus tenuis TaxID=148309 RepID=A0AAD5WF64_PARTN|nr:hypothetical protein KIN20_028576 [Parelaphostrongylus tenuis]